MSVERDREEILRLHRAWWQANRDWDIPKMRTIFAGDRFYQFNFNGHPYYSLDELTALWEALDGKLSIPEISEPKNLRIEISGDMAWLACENIVRIELAPGVEAPGIPTTPLRIRSTEVYQRSDGAGTTTWKMWHFHCSPTAADDAPRLPFGDTYGSRG